MERNLAIIITYTPLSCGAEASLSRVDCFITGLPLVPVCIRRSEIYPQPPRKEATYVLVSLVDIRRYANEAFGLVVDQ